MNSIEKIIDFLQDLYRASILYTTTGLPHGEKLPFLPESGANYMYIRAVNYSAMLRQKSSKKGHVVWFFDTEEDWLNTVKTFRYYVGSSHQNILLKIDSDYAILALVVCQHIDEIELSTDRLGLKVPRILAWKFVKIIPVPENWK